MDEDFDISHVEGFQNAEMEITQAAWVASMENEELSETYHDDKLAEERVAEGVFSDASAVASTVGASDQSFEVVGESMQWADDKSSVADLIPGYDRSSQIDSAMNSLAPVGLKHFWENDFWSSMFDGRGDTIHGAYNFNRPVNLLPLEAVVASEPSNVRGQRNRWCSVASWNVSGRCRFSRGRRREMRSMTGQSDDGFIC